MLLCIVLCNGIMSFVPYSISFMLYYARVNTILCHMATSHIIQDMTDVTPYSVVCHCKTLHNVILHAILYYIVLYTITYHVPLH